MLCDAASRRVVSCHANPPPPNDPFKICEGFRCATFDMGGGTTRRFLLADYNVDCDTAEYKVMRAYLVLAVVIVPIGLPLGALIKLIQMKKQLDALGTAEKAKEAEARAEEKKAAYEGRGRVSLRTTRVSELDGFFMNVKEDLRAQECSKTQSIIIKIDTSPVRAWLPARTTTRNPRYPGVSTNHG